MTLKNRKTKQRQKQTAFTKTVDLTRGAKTRRQTFPKLCELVSRLAQICTYSTAGRSYVVIAIASQLGQAYTNFAEVEGHYRNRPNAQAMLALRASEVLRAKYMAHWTVSVFSAPSA